MSRNVMPVKVELMKIGFHEFEVFDWFYYRMEIASRLMVI
jgi:hypothetical protein